MGIEGSSAESKGRSSAPSLDPKIVAASGGTAVDTVVRKIDGQEDPTSTPTTPVMAAPREHKARYDQQAFASWMRELAGRPR